MYAAQNRSGEGPSNKTRAHVASFPGSRSGNKTRAHSASFPGSRSGNKTRAQLGLLIKFCVVIHIIEVCVVWDVNANVGHGSFCP